MSDEYNFLEFHPKTYRVVKSPTTLEGNILEGWAVEHLHDGCYVAWGLKTRAIAKVYAAAFQNGIQYMGSKF